MNVSRILVPVDYSEQSRRALEYGAALAEAFGAPIDVVHCWDRPSYVPDNVYIERPGGKRRPLVEVLREDAEHEMSEFLGATRLPPGVSVGRHLVSGEPAAAILSRAKKSGHDLIVIGTNGRTGVRQLLLGSVAARLVRLAPVPVITIPPGMRPSQAPG